LSLANIAELADSLDDELMDLLRASFPELLGDPSDNE
jgi:hypothetical protein